VSGFRVQNVRFEAWSYRGVVVAERHRTHIRAVPRLVQRGAQLRLRIWGVAFGVWGLGFGVWGLGFGVWGLGFGVWDFGVWGLGFEVWGLGFRVEGLECWV